MIKDILRNIVKGISFSIGFSVTIVIVIYLLDAYKPANTFDYQSEQEKRQIEVLEYIIDNLPKDAVNMCSNIEGTWYGSTETNNGSKIINWEVTYRPGGLFKRKLITKTITKEEVQVENGTWKCDKAILFTNSKFNGVDRRDSYLLLDSNEDEITHVSLGSYSFEQVITLYRKDSPQ